MKLTILGYNSAVPTVRTNPTSQLLECNNQYFLIDCGEGTQVQLRKARVKFTHINTIFISHLHGDHVFGLIGLISSFHLLGRTEPLTIYGPKGIKKLIEIQLLLTESSNQFDINFIELTSLKSELIYEDNKLCVWTIPLNHRIYTNGFLFKEKVKPRRLNMDVIKYNPEIEVCDYHNLKLGKDFITQSGDIIKNEYLTLPPKHSYSYAFCSDTKFSLDIVPLIKGVDVLYHEATFLDELRELASKTGHTTAYQAAEIAKMANVKVLILGHFSNRYTDISILKEEAGQVFFNTILPEELLTLDFNKLIIN
ncbi:MULTISPECIES: ribonuclease Z [unclassified Apibacter]|uniref:ribonuclease Z n=1 Tax=unclassified Apibacter TaxID=2630820 RepID=UPI00135DD45C|nr:MULTISPECIES: ribonuclease Z [unclassified Apibacter]MXP05885.1 ribonuclease Z [Apibacter sp. B3546]MXP12596.1 ribonuclease Z [Apibacter sp. B3239]